MSNYDMDEIERNKSQKQKEQWREYVDESLKHPLDNRYSSQEGFGRDDQTNIKEILQYLFFSEINTQALKGLFTT